MRLLHTSDWHLGHVLHGMSREREHREFLRWLVETLRTEEVDALVITGDIFDSATPSASAEAAWFDFLAEARRARPEMAIVAIAGNHDSPSRLCAPAAILRRLGVHVVGSLPRRPRIDGGGFDFDRVLISVAQDRALIAAVPFLRSVDLGDLGVASSDGDGDGRDSDGASAVYREVAAAARLRLRPDQAFIVTGHLYTAGAEPSLLSERRIAVGGQEALPPELFPADASYVALGHLHRAQRVLADHVRYAGAPIPLAMVESSYRHQVVVIDFEGARASQIRTLSIPRTVDIVRVPRLGAASLQEVLAELARLPALGDRSEADPTRSFLEVVVALHRPEPRLRTTIDAALEGKWPRLIRLGVEPTGDGAALGDQRRGQQLAELAPTEVFERCWHRRFGDAPSQAIRGAFHRLLEEVQHSDEDRVLS
jgi:DNA repair protein SbcD/Mre11